jgi:hypothetical protein
MTINEQIYQNNTGFFVVDDYIDDVLENYFSLNQIINTIANNYQPQNLTNSQTSTDSFDSIKDEIKIIENNMSDK